MADTVSEPSVFTKIINRELPATIQYEDDEFIVIDNIKPVAPIHFLVIIKEPYPTLEDIDIENVELLGRMIQVARKVAKKLGIAHSYKLYMNVGVQMVRHVHLHVTGGWPKDVTKAELDRVSKLLHDDDLKPA
jgi:histidine triad (HIT) family protein